MTRTWLLRAASLLWGLQFSLLNPAIALLLVSLYGASAQQVGWVLAIYNASGFIASIVIPAWADRRRDYVIPALASAVATLALAIVLALVTTLPMAALALVALGGPAGVGISMLFAQVRYLGAPPREVMNTRAVFSFAWVAGPPLATFLMGAFGNRAVLPAVAGVAVLTIITTLALVRTGRAAEDEAAHAPDQETRPARKGLIAAVLVAFVALQATNSAAVSVMSLFVVERMGLAVMWAGIALAVSAAAEIPALVLIGRLTGRFSQFALLVSGCVAGLVFYAGMAVVRGPVLLLALQVLNAWFVGIVTGVGLTLLQDIVPRLGLASGLFMNARRVGAIVSGPLIGLGAATPLGYSGVWVGCAALVAVGLLIILPAGRRLRAGRDL